MSKDRKAKFSPHLYARHLTRQGAFAADSALLYQWTGLYWQALDDIEAEREAYSWLVSCDSSWASAENARRAVRAAVLHAPPLPPLTDKIVIPTCSGYVHLDGFELVLRSADKALGLTHCVMCDYTPQATAPKLFTEFLVQVLPDAQVRARVQEYVGYTLMADTRYQHAQFWLGEGANGKGVLANIVQALHGRVAAVALDQLSGFQLSRLLGASLVYVDEVPRRRIDEQALKSMIAGERIAVDRKYREPLSIHVRGKWLVLGNQLPAISDHSFGFWRRWDIVPFPVTIPENERNPVLAQTIIRDELSGVLNWALAGLVRLQRRGGFDVRVPQSMHQTISEAKAETNSVVAWLDDQGIGLRLTCDTSKDAVYQGYRAWCAASAMREVSVVQFWKRMKMHFRELQDGRRRVDGALQRVCNVALEDGGA